jgi:hypothetical protein
MISCLPIFKDSKWRRVIAPTFFSGYLFWIVRVMGMNEAAGA